MTERDNGFTLIELLIALSLFALVSLLAVALLRTSIDTQNQINTRLRDGGSIERLRALLASELMVAQPAIARGSDGVVNPAFAGSASAISFTSAADTGDGESPLRRLTVSIDGGAVRLSRDGGAAAALVDEITSARFRFRLADGGWADGWAPPRPDALPRAVELNLTPRGSAPLTLRFFVAPGPEVAT